MPTTLTVLMDDAGRISVNGPIENPVLCFGLLEIAKLLIADRAKAQESKVQLAGMGALGQFERLKD